MSETFDSYNERYGNARTVDESQFKTKERKPVKLSLADYGSFFIG